MDEQVKQSIVLLDRVEAFYAPRLQSLLLTAIHDLIRQFSEGFALPVIPVEFRRPIITAISGLWWDSINGEAALLADEFKDAFPFLERKDGRENEIRQLVENYADKYGSRRAAEILLTTERQTQDLIRGGMARGESANAVITAAMAKAAGTAELRSLIITRTEAHTASQYAAYRLADKAQIPLNKIWNTTVDDATRRLPNADFDHLIMNGREVSLHQHFHVPTRAGGIERLRFPGDPDGSAGNVINCRCIQTFRRQE